MLTVSSWCDNVPTVRLIKNLIRRGGETMNDFFQGDGVDVLFNGEGMDANTGGWALEMNCAVCRAPLVAPWPYVACSIMDAEIRGDTYEILYSDCWFTLCPICSESYDLESLRPCVKKSKSLLDEVEVKDPGDWPQRLASQENVIDLDSFRSGHDDQDDSEVLYYTECTMCGRLIYEKTPFKVFDISVENRISEDVGRLEETILTLEICSDCARNVDFRTLTVWNKKKKVIEIHSFKKIFPQGARQVVVKILT